jgi:hypothetical protein
LQNETVDTVDSEEGRGDDSVNTVQGKTQKAEGALRGESRPDVNDPSTL